MSRGKKFGATVQSKASVRLELLVLFLVIVAGVFLAGPTVATFLSSGKLVAPKVSVSLPQQSAQAAGGYCTPQRIDGVGQDSAGNVYAGTSIGTFKWDTTYQMWEKYAGSPTSTVIFGDSVGENYKVVRPLNAVPQITVMGRNSLFSSRKGC